MTCFSSPSAGCTKQSTRNWNVRMCVHEVVSFTPFSLFQACYLRSGWNACGKTSRINKSDWNLVLKTRSEDVYERLWVKVLKWKMRENGFGPAVMEQIALQRDLCRWHESLGSWWCLRLLFQLFEAFVTYNLNMDKKGALNCLILLLNWIEIACEFNFEH